MSWNENGVSDEMMMMTMMLIRVVYFDVDNGSTEVDLVEDGGH